MDFIVDFDQEAERDRTEEEDEDRGWDWLWSVSGFLFPGRCPAGQPDVVYIADKLETGEGVRSRMFPSARCRVTWRVARNRQDPKNARGCIGARVHQTVGNRTGSAGSGTRTGPVPTHKPCLHFSDTSKPVGFTGLLTGFLNRGNRSGDGLGNPDRCIAVCQSLFFYEVVFLLTESDNPFFSDTSVVLAYNNSIGLLKKWPRKQPLVQKWHYGIY
jgi:hypothetical protein